MDIKSEKHLIRSRRTTIIIIIIALVIVPILLFKTFTNNLVDKITRTISLQYSQELNEQMSAHLSSALDYYFHELNTEYNALKQIDNLSEEKLTNFIAQTEVSNDSSYLAFADDDGYVYESGGAYLGTMRISILGRLLNGEERVIEDSVTVGSDSYIMLGCSFSDPIMMGDKKICIALLGMDTDELSQDMILKSNHSGGYASLIHANGSYIIKNTSESGSGLNVFSLTGKKYGLSSDELADLKSAIHEGGTYFMNVGDEVEGNSVYLYFAPVEGTQWYIENTMPSSFIKSSVVDLRDTIENVYIVFVVFFLLIAALIIFQQMSSSRKLKASQKELEHALKVAEEANGAKTSFLFSMSHDIRTPMNAILGYTDIGLKHVEDKAVSEDSYQKIRTAGSHLLSLINDVLEMSRIESGKMSLDEKPLDIRDAISDVTTMSQSLAVAKSIDFETVVGEISNPYIYADELHINQVLINIISNAVKYTPTGGKVRYKVNQLEGINDGKVTFRFEVTDNGIGMSEAFQEHLFETFSREKNTTMSKTEGTGLGLSIVKKIVDMASGEISVKSRQGVGSTFIVEIPFRVLNEQETEEYITEKAKSGEITADVDLSGKKVLLVEDNELNREIASCILEDAGLVVEEAEDGYIAVNAVDDKGADYYDFILMDIQMPVMNGYEATKKIRSLPGGGNIPIIALSANAFEEDKKKSIEEGMNAHVAKPIDIKVLLETMQSLIK